MARRPDGGGGGMSPGAEAGFQKLNWAWVVALRPDSAWQNWAWVVAHRPDYQLGACTEFHIAVLVRVITVSTGE